MKNYYHFTISKSFKQEVKKTDFWKQLHSNARLWSCDINIIDFGSEVKFYKIKHCKNLI